MFKIKFDNKNQYQGKDSWFGKETFNRHKEAEDFLLANNYRKLDEGVYEEIDYCPMIAYIEKF